MADEAEGRPLATALALLADSVKVAQPIRPLIQLALVFKFVI